jgi:hypothetical protein
MSRLAYTQADKAERRDDRHAQLTEDERTAYRVPARIRQEDHLENLNVSERIILK